MSGITIPGVTYVLTDGTINRSELDDDNAPGLKRYYLSRAGITQQIGRAGRDIPGGVGELCAPVHTKRIKSASEVAKGQRSKKTNQHDEPTSKGMPYLPFEERDEHEPPEIYSTILSRVVLSVATLGYSFYELNEYIPNRVKKINIINAEEVLTRLGALDDDGLVTETGKLMDRFPVTPELSRGLVEASRRNRSLQHMVRAALSASAISVGGIEDHRANEDAVKMRKQIIRRTTEDDLIAQLDLMEKLYERTDEEHDGYGFIERHGLHPKRVELAQKMTRKILSAMGIKPQNIVVTAPVPDEEQLLREDFSTGFIDYVYEDVGLVPRSKKISYRNIHGNSESTTRTISDRSVMKPSRGQLVAGIPRWYEKGERKDGTPIKHDIIDHVFKVEADVIGRVALKNGLIQDVWKESRMEGDQVVDYRQGTFGSIFVGSLEKRASSEHISEASQEVLVQYVLNNKGRVQQALRGLAEELEGYRNRIPPEVLSQLRKPNAPEDVTQSGITEMIRAAARTTASAHGIEDWLARYAYSANITLEKYYDTESIVKLNEMSPAYITLGGENLPLWYENGYPYVTNVMKRHLLRVTNPVYLADGREVLYQRRASGSGRTERVSFGAPREV